MFSYTFVSVLVSILSISKNKNGLRVLSLRLFYFWRKWDLKKKRTFNRKGYSTNTSSLWHVSQTTKRITNGRFYTIHEFLKYRFGRKNYFRKCLIVAALKIISVVNEIVVNTLKVNSSKEASALKNNCSKEANSLKTNYLEVNGSETS